MLVASPLRRCAGGGLFYVCQAMAGAAWRASRVRYIRRAR